MKTKHTFILLLILSTIPFALNAQGKISGKVIDKSTGEPIVGANIIIEGTNLGAASDIEGEYVIVRVPSGKYNVAASYIGYQKVITQNVQVLNDLTTRLDFELTPSDVKISEDIVVVAQAPLVKKDLTATEARVTSEEIRQLPLQDLNSLITLQAGVNRDAGGGIHIRGGRSSEISYLINGISITDDFSRSQALQVETESVQELQVISGTFNAEYGNAMSGVVNIITKTGGSKFQSNFEVWTGDYLSNHTDIFWNIDDFNPTANFNLQASAGGPLFNDDVHYFFAARRYYDGGYIYGRNIYSPQGRYKFENGQLVENPGDSSYVSMNSSDRWSGQASFSWQMFDNLKLKIDAFGSSEENRFYDHVYRLNPYGTMGGKSAGYTFFANLTHLIHQNTFQEFTVAYKYNDYKSRLYEDPFDPRYVHPDSLNVPGYHFLRAGTNLNRFQRNTRSVILKWDFTSQIDKINLVKFGVEYQTDKVFYENINLIPAVDENGQQLQPFVPAIQTIDSPQHDRFERTPDKFSAYIQDKIEFESLIINIGLRFDLFNPNGRIPVDPSDPNIFNPFKLEHIYKDANNDGKIGLDEQTESNKFTLEEKERFWYKETSVKTQLSPRLGIAYPITDKGIIRFSYGIFQQIPEYGQLYIGDQYKLTSAQGIQGPFGNPDLKPQRTTIYELGLQQQFFEDFAIDITAFYRDIRDWISSSQPIPTFLAGISYSKRINRDFANVRGITLAVNKRFTNNYSFGVDYTFQIAEGTNSSPDQEFFSQLNGAEPTKILTPLDWDQTHTLNANVYIGGETWGASIISSLHTGQPYTPTFIAGAYTGRNVLAGLANNSRRKPLIARVDLEVRKNIKILDSDVQFFVKVFNLFDAKNPVLVFGDTGKPDFTIEQLQVRDYDPDWFVYPNFYSEPRSVYVGTKISL
jgi:outer membrane receptor protein involved in Fe transport